jgi:hypothetical protein
MAATKLLTIRKILRVNSLVDHCVVSKVADKSVMLLSMLMVNHRRLGPPSTTRIMQPARLQSFQIRMISSLDWPESNHLNVQLL